MISFDALAAEVFQIIRSFDYTVTIYDDDGNQVYEPEQGRRFFIRPDNMLISIIEAGDDSSIRQYLSKSTGAKEVIGLIDTLRTSATKYNMVLNIRETGRDLRPSDFATRSSVTENKEATMNILEGMYGTSRSSYLKLENARLIVRHSKRINENVIGSRGRHIDAIFVENAQGERMLFPTRQLLPARAEAQHVNQGGNFNDAISQQIMRMANDYANLSFASGQIATQAPALAESAMSIRETVRGRMAEMKKCFERLARSSGYLHEAEQLRGSSLTEDDETEVAPDITEVKKVLTCEGFELSDAVLTSIAEALRESGYELPVTEDDDEDENDPKLHVSREKYKEEMVYICGRPVSKEAWDAFVGGNLELSHPPELGTNGEMPKFLNKDAEMVYLLGQIIPQVRDDSMLNLLSYVDEELQNPRVHPEVRKKMRTIARFAIKYAGLSMNEGISTNNEVIREFNEWLGQFTTSKVLNENWDDDENEQSRDTTDAAKSAIINRIIRGPDKELLVKYGPTKVMAAIDDEASGLYDLPEIGSSDISCWIRNISDALAGGSYDHIEEGLSEDEDDDMRYADNEPRFTDDEDELECATNKLIDDFDINAFMNKYGSDFFWENGGFDTSELSDEEKTFDEKYGIGLISSYLEKELYNMNSMNADMDDAAQTIWDEKIKPLMSDAGYNLQEYAQSGNGEISFSKIDLVIPTNQGEDFEREVTKPSSTDPYTGIF